VSHHSKKLSRQNSWHKRVMWRCGSAIVSIFQGLSGVSGWGRQRLSFYQWCPGRGGKL